MWSPSGADCLGSDLSPTLEHFAGGLAPGRSVAAVSADVPSRSGCAPTLCLHRARLWGGCFVPSAASREGAVVCLTALRLSLRTPAVRRGHAMGAQMGAAPQA